VIAVSAGGVVWAVEHTGGTRPEAWWASAQSPWCGNLWKAARRLDHIAQRR